MPRWWLRLIPGLIIIYYVRVQACLTQWWSDIFLLICWTHYPMQWLFSWFYPKAHTGSMKTTCFSLFAQLWLCNIGKYYWHIWARWILNKALPTFLLFLITWEIWTYHFVFTQTVTEDCSECMQPSTINCSCITVHYRYIHTGMIDTLIGHLV